MTPTHVSKENICNAQTLVRNDIHVSDFLEYCLFSYTKYIQDLYYICPKKSIASWKIRLFSDGKYINLEVTMDEIE